MESLASGFAGEELIRLLTSHESTKLLAVSSRELNGMPVSQFIKGSDLLFSDADDEVFFQWDVIFFDTPHGLALQNPK